MHKTTLKNGLRILEIPQNNSLAVTILVLVGTGAKNETEDIQGVSHFLEHMFFKGTKKRKNAIKVSEPLDRIGGMYNAFTGYDYTGYYAKVDAKHFDLALDWVSDIFLNSLLPPKEIEKEKGVVIEELNMDNDAPMQRVQTLWRTLLYGKQAAGRNIVGTKESIKSLTRKHMYDYMKSQYVAQNTVVCVAGNLKEETRKDIEKKFRSVKNSPFRARDQVGETQTEPEILLEDRKTDQSHLCLGMRSFPVSHENRWTQEVLATILGGMMSSRLFIEIREKRGLAYYISTHAELEPDLGYMMTRAGVRNEKVEEAVATILKEYRKVANQGISVKELQKAKENMKGKMALQLESSDSQASFYGLQEITEGEVLSPERIYEKIDHVTKAQVKLLAQELMVPARLNLALTGPYKNKEALRKLMTAL